MKRNNGNIRSRLVWIIAIIIFIFIGSSCLRTVVDTAAQPTVQSVTTGTTHSVNQEQLRNLISFEIYTDTWNLASYEPLETNRRQHYINLLIQEMNKYPDGFFDRIGLRTIALGKNLKFQGAFRAAVPDNHKRILFMGIRDDYSDDYFKHVFHHELNHFVEYYIWKSYRYDWDQWRVLFRGSGGGGELAYQGGEDRTAITYNPNLSGFLNNYSTLGQEEDRSEMIAFFLTENRNMQFMEKAKRDKLFNQKAVLLFTFYKEKLNWNLLNDFLLKMN
ncbi:MAG: hypothetical protein FWC03_13010 [Treponema sp.]|nr:hypothetical protein [Treponema sp.]